MTDDLETPTVTTNEIHWSTSDLLDVPPVRLVTELDPMELRQRLAAFVDGRHVNDLLYRSVVAIRSSYGGQPGAYVVVFPDQRLELPIDLREVSDEPGRLIGIVKDPRATYEMIFDLAELQGVLADQMAGMPREAAIGAMKSLSETAQSFTVHDRCDHDERFAHEFSDGTYHHNYRYVSSRLPGVEE